MVYPHNQVACNNEDDQATITCSKMNIPNIILRLKKNNNKIQNTYNEIALGIVRNEVKLNHIVEGYTHCDKV